MESVMKRTTATGFLSTCAISLALTFIALINYMKLGAERIDALCKTPVLPEGIIEDVVNSEIEFRHVSFSYNADIPVLRDVSLTIPEKELTAFVGPSGSGKTTLTRLIARFWDVSEVVRRYILSAVSIAGRSKRGMTCARYRSILEKQAEPESDPRL